MTQPSEILVSGSTAKPPGEVITFYSYKGGVGRSMAVANVGTTLAFSGKRVLLLDFDFEAPGLHRYFTLPTAGTGAPEQPSRGVLELLTDAYQELRTPPPPVAAATRTSALAEMRKTFAALLDGAHRPREFWIRDDQGGSKTVSLLSAGLFDGEYPARVRALDCAGIHREFPQFFEALALELSARFDYVLVDSRTGITDVGSVCTVLLPEKLVLVFTANEQSLNGAVEIGRQAVQQRTDSEDGRALPLFPLLSRVENAEDELQRQWTEEARRRFEEVFKEVYGLDSVDLSFYFQRVHAPHRSFYAYGEVIAAERDGTRRANSLGLAYGTFCNFLSRESVYDAQTELQALENQVSQSVDASRTALTGDWLRLAPRPRALSLGQKYHVYLSYRSANRPWVLSLYDVLRQLGFEVFLDTVVLRAGDEFARVSENARQSSQAAVLVWSSASADSEWAWQEYQRLEALADAQPAFALVPVLLESGLSLQVFARNRAFIDFSAYPDGPNGGELLRLLHALVGMPLSPDAAAFALQQDETARRQAGEVTAAIRNRDPDQLLQLLDQGGAAWDTSPTLACTAIDGLIKLGRDDEAIAALEQLESRFPRALRPRQLHARALLSRRRDADLTNAQRLLGVMYEAGARDPVTLNMYAQTWQARFEISHERSDLQQARELYAEAFECAPDEYYAGIKAGSLSLALGTPQDLRQARGYAERVLKVVGAEPKVGDYWPSVAVGEALLLSGDFARAASAFHVARASAPSVREHESIWQWVAPWLDRLGPSAEERAAVRSAFAGALETAADPQQRVAAVAGRRIDAGEANERRFPERNVAAVREGVKRLLKEQRVHTVVVSAACGADIVALEAALELRLRVKVVLPFSAERFRESSVVDRGQAWGQRFDDLLKRPEVSANLVVVAEDAAADDAAYARATRRIIEEARSLATQYGVKPMALAIWDEKPRGTADATQDFIEQAGLAGVEVIELSTQPLELAEAYVDGGEQEPEPLLDFWPDLARAEPVLAGGLARALATRFLHGKKRMRKRAVDRIWKACKEVDAFAFARRILGRRLAGSDQIIDEAYAGEPNDARLRQQQALCTSKDPDLSAGMRHDWALRILKAREAPSDPEIQGIAGGIWKRRWEWDGSRSSLEKALQHYRAGSPHDLNQFDAGYCTINHAFLLDLLASQLHDDMVAAQYRAQATSLRRQLVGALKAAGNLWTEASLAEAYLGLSQFEAAGEAVKNYMRHGPGPWELETTLRQLVRLAHLLELPRNEVSAVLQVAFGPDGEKQRTAALRSLLTGRVGLALSGGGFRASLYHLGVLARLAESDVLRQVEVLSCVSGGSIVGAHYYLCLREELQANGEQLTRDDYVRIVKRVIDAFVKGVAHNVRTRVLATYAHSIAVVSGDNRAYAEAVSKTLHDTFYAPLLAEDKPLHELLIQPKESPHNFHPGRHNWLRHNKVPVLVLNAATLNTGHCWQFTARSMGESPFSIVPGVDGNARLRRPNYRHGIADRTVRLRDAVAASACVPGLFAPLQLEKLYPGYDVRLVDGGVFDNQGAASLIEQDCQVLLISDAAGQLFAASEVEGGHVQPLLRSISIFQERIRQTGYDALFKRKEAGQLRGLAYTHLTQGLKIDAVDWDKCEDPQQPNDQLPDDIGNRSGTGAGVDREIQGYLAAMRTDLDVFSQIECAALMASGYKSMDGQLHKLFADVPALDGKRRVESDWFFAGLLPIVSGQDYKPKEFVALRRHLQAASLKIGRSFKMDHRFRVLVTAIAGLVGVVVVGLIWSLRDHVLLTVGKVALMAIPIVLGVLFGSAVKKVSGVVLDPRRVLMLPLQHWGSALLLTAFARVILRWVDPAYLERGQLDKLSDG